KERISQGPAHTNKIFLRVPLCPLWLSFLPSAENCRTYTNASRTFFDCHLEVMRHTHRKFIKRYRRETTVRETLAQFSQLSKVGSGTLWVLGVRWDRHQSPELQVCKPVCFFQNSLQFRRFRVDSTLGSFTTNIDLDEHGQFLSSSSRGVIQP